MNVEMDIRQRLDRLRVLAPAGYAIALHVRFTTPSYLFQTYPAAWIEEYAQQGLVLRDPTVAWAFAHEGNITWAELSATDPAGVIERATRHGLGHGLTVSLLRDGSRSMASFARPDRPFEGAEIEEIEQAMAGLHDATAQDLGSPEIRRISASLQNG